VILLDKELEPRLHMSEILLGMVLDFLSRTLVS
jgi:hypothetical protein